MTENPSSEVAAKDHSSSNPPKGNPPDLKTTVDGGKVDVKGFPTYVRPRPTFAAFRRNLRKPQRLRLQEERVQSKCFRAIKSRWETKGRFLKRVVLANVPSFRFPFRGNMRMYPHSGFRSGGTSECTLVPVLVPGEHPNLPSFRFSFRGNIRQNHPFGNHPFCQPQKGG